MDQQQRTRPAPRRQKRVSLRVCDAAHLPACGTDIEVDIFRCSGQAEKGR